MSLKQKLQEAAVAVEDCRRKLEQAEQLYDSLFKQATSGTKSKKPAAASEPGTTTAPAPHANGAPVANFTDRIRAILTAAPQKEWTNSELQKHLPDIPTTTLPSLLHRLRTKGKVVKVGYGKWRAT
jgi:hypothetical protein